MKIKKPVTTLGLLFCCLSGTVRGRRSGLPAVRTPQEMARSRKHRKSKSHLDRRVLVDDIVQDFPPPNTIVRLPAEYEPISAVVLSAQYETVSMYDVVRKLVEYTNVEVYLIDGPQDLVDSDTYHPLVGVPSDSVWTRDYGPVGVLLSSDDLPGEDESMVILDNIYYPGRINDDAVSCEIADLYSDWPCIQTNFYFEGGNHLIDDQGNFYMTEITYEWLELSHFTKDEVDGIIKRLFGVKNVYALPYARNEDGGRFPYDTAHLDMMASIVRPCKVIVSETTAPAWQEATDAIATFFANQTCGENEEKYQVFRTPAWFEPLPGDDPEYSIWYTYANSLLANDLVLIPEFSRNTTQNEEAIAVYQEACPECIVSGVNMDGFITLSGAVHCMTRQLPLASNAPSAFDIASVSCDGVTSPSCDISSLSEVCVEQMAALKTAVSEEACQWQTIVFEHNCCSDLSARELVYPADQSAPMFYVWAFVDDQPFETSWLVLDELSGEVVASSPIFNTTYGFVEHSINLPAGSYIALFTDLGGSIDLSPSEFYDYPSFGIWSETAIYSGEVYSEVLENYYKAGRIVVEVDISQEKCKI